MPQYIYHFLILLQLSGWALHRWPTVYLASPLLMAFRLCPGFLSISLLICKMGTNNPTL